MMSAERQGKNVCRLSVLVYHLAFHITKLVEPQARNYTVEQQ